ncbi:averantin oxidoreductase [Pyricularia oryzae 70-15]|uniref:Averantin oxidoreductase n=1 Tax=Pyricularia oryzae (strain 70-15 / ATCC MYA-4617 / FGSC 8958) TaxID=242507 RepID=G4MRL4_PYRO7|nr:averantin oxidoreductase [Pyricularia oryzae 70-15]EHA57437.1 averantin oxidoreductase [Pyricularia oryzae 70-15]KAI7928575.1 averantin oxidoreductase [Pyricularia oryzae]KAI7928736.1 averantin oxidoreductase [Pyricularia oryzae]
MRGDQVQWMHSMHLKYGPVVRFGPDELSYVDQGGSAWKAIYGQEKGAKEFPRLKAWYVEPFNGINPITSVPAHEIHRRFRAAFSPAFSERALRSQEPLFRRQIDLLISILASDAAETGGPANLTELFEFTTFDIMGDLALGEPLGMLQTQQYSKWMKALASGVRIMPVFQFIQHYPLVSKIFSLLEPEWVTQLKYEHHQYNVDRVNARLARESSSQADIWSYVLSTKEKQRLTVEEMHSNAESFMIAGSETTATAMTALTYFLTTSPSRFSRLKNEIRSRFSSEEDITMETTSPLKYLNACIQEALRMYPPLPVGVPREVTSPGATILGRWVPGGTQVSVHHYASSHSPGNFTDPDTFAPERWLAREPADGDNGTNATDSARYGSDRLEATQPFTVGPRNCLGKSMAMHEMRLMLACLYFRFDMELVSDAGAVPWNQQKAFAFWDKKPLMCKIKLANGGI